MIDEIIDFITDGLSYIFSFQWLEDIGEFFSSMFENITEISMFGIVFGLVGFGTVFFARDYMLKPFLVHMTTTTAFFWMIATYIGCFITGYFIGKHFENT